MPEEFRHSDCLHSLEELKLENIPNGSAAFEKVSFVDSIQILIFAGLIDICNVQSESKEYLDDFESLDTHGIPINGSLQRWATASIASLGIAVQLFIALSWSCQKLAFSGY